METTITALWEGSGDTAFKRPLPKRERQKEDEIEGLLRQLLPEGFVQVLVETGGREYLCRIQRLK